MDSGEPKVCYSEELAYLRSNVPILMVSSASASCRRSFKCCSSSLTVMLGRKR